MSELRLIIGNKNYSSWSLRPWLAMKVAGIAFAAERIPLYGPGSQAKILAFSPAGKLPFPRAGYLPVWAPPGTRATMPAITTDSFQNANETYQGRSVRSRPLRSA